jgi:hypothetical protein
VLLQSPQPTAPESYLYPAEFCEVSDQIYCVGLLELYADDRIPCSALDTQISTKTAAQEAVKQRISDLEEQLQSPLTQDIVDELVAFSERVAARFEDIEREDDFLFKQELVAILNARALAYREDGLQKLKFRSMLRETVLQYRQLPTNPQCSDLGHP